MKQSVFIIFFISLSVSIIAGGDTTTNWRGPNANGIYDQPGLMETWPSGGPEIMWVYEALGNGFSSPVFSNEKIYLTGEADSTGYLFLLTETGELIKKIPYGKEFIQSYPGSRSTPVVVENLIYMLSAEGVVCCMDESTGKQVWIKDLFTDFDGKNIRWGITESLVLDGDKLFVSPGGEQHSLVALNRFSGDLIWSVQAESGLSAYCTPLLFEFGEEKMIATVMGDKIIGVEREKGLLRWSYEYRNQRSIHPNTPIYHDGNLFCFSGYGYGGVKLQISDDNNRVEKKYWSNEIESKMGGAVLLNGILYGSGDKNKGWHAVDWNSGELLYKSDELGNGVVIAANGFLYIYTDRGELALVKPGEKEFQIAGQAKVIHGTAQHWAHPVIHQGVLYVRHGTALIAYGISKQLEWKD